ncbi:MAG: cysteine desulfurase [Planctomycetes bacterium]|nr:cysteine desulfurase [Planctomycetota bacterium]
MIYLDYNATTPTDPRVVEAMLPYLREHHGNPSSVHAMGRRVHTAVEAARLQVADLLGATPNEIVFTSSGTEANNQVIKGVADMHRGKPCHMIISAIEHPAVEKPCRYLETNGVRITAVEVDRAGMVDPDDVGRAISADTVLVSIMHANNEVGTIQPIAEIAEIARSRGAWCHTDAAQSCGKIETDVGKLGVDFLSIAGHKLYGPQGIGALYMRTGIEIEPYHHGAGHEGGRRAGTEPVPALVGLGKAAELAKSHVGDPHLKMMRDRLHEGLGRELGDKIVLLGHPELRLPNTLAVAFPGCIGSDILAACPGICASTGAACHAGGRKVSGTLAAMNVPEETAFGAIRFSVGCPTTEAEIDEATRAIVAAVETNS